MDADCSPKGVLLLTFGGPDSLEAVEQFMTSIMGGRKPPAPLLAKMLERYKLIGGKSPLPRVSQEQARLLQETLNSEGQNYRVYVGMLHCHPFIKDSLSRMIQAGVRDIAALSLSPHYAQVTTGAYSKAIEEARQELNENIKLSFCQGFYTHPLFVDGLTRELEKALEEFPVSVQPEVEIIFTAHSLPLAHIAAGDPYVDQLRASVEALVARKGLTHWSLAFQSKGGGQGEWLGPEVELILEKIAASGKKHVLVFPIGFATDHIETLYDIDVSQREYAHSLGLNFHRALALNTSPQFIQVMAEAVRAAF